MDRLLALPADWPLATQLVKALALLLAGWFIANLLQRLLTPVLTTRLDRQNGQFLARLLFWVVIGLFAVSALRELGFELSVLLSAAGILTVALGFASQTSAANIISGLFLMGERSFGVGDLIQIDTHTGEVLSIDWLSVKLRTFDNLYVRIPNEQIIKTTVVNLSRHPIRRFDLRVGVAYKEDIARVRSTLLRVAEENPLCLEYPEPLIILQGFGESSIDIQFSVWAPQANYLELRNRIFEEVKLAFDQQGIEIPFPHRTLYAGVASAPYRVQVSNPEPDPGQPSAGRPEY